MPLISKGKAYCCSILSLMGVLFLAVLGILYSAEARTLVMVEAGGELSPQHDIATSLYISAGVYAVFFLFSASQAYLYSKQERRGIAL
ncbi:hypothetical protein RI367_006026 [Sorochytrium milnesiophthora]